MLRRIFEKHKKNVLNFDYKYISEHSHKTDTLTSIQHTVHVSTCGFVDMNLPFHFQKEALRLGFESIYESKLIYGCYIDIVSKFPTNSMLIFEHLQKKQPD